MGTDISFQVIHGVGKTSRSKTGSKIRGPKENIHATFEQYGHSPLLADVFVADTSVPSFRSAPLFDAIVTDRMLPQRWSKLASLRITSPHVSYHHALWRTRSAAMRRCPKLST